jgi:hypothetical protein
MKRTRGRDAAKEAGWRKIVLDWLESGKSRKQFCRERQLSIYTFDYWRGQLLRRDRQAKADHTAAETKTSSKPNVKPVGLVPVRIIASEPLEIRLPRGRSIAVPLGFDPKQLRAVLDLLEEDRSC